MNYPLRIRQVSPASSLENFHFYKMEWFTEVNNLNIKEEAKKEILKVFQTYDQVGIAFSGGKDSTVLLDLVLKILREKKEKELFVIHNDTLVENPIVRTHCDVVLQDVEDYAKRNNLKVKVFIAKPEVKNTFWVNLIGKGYPLPNHNFRWCQDKLKIKPSSKLIKSLGVKALFVGLRSDESIQRMLRAKQFHDYTLMQNGILRVAPLLNWTTIDVFEYLLNEEEGFTDFKKVYKLYKDANGECPILFDPKLSNVPKKGCGARFGCWVCSLVKEDKSTKNLLSHYSWLEPYFRFREWMISFCEKTENRTGRRRNGKILGEGRGQLTLKAREEILKKLKNLEREVGKELLSNEEFLFITNSWGEELKRKT